MSTSCVTSIMENEWMVVVRMSREKSRSKRVVLIH